MKTRITTIAFVAFTLIGSTPMTEARDHHVQTYAGVYTDGYGSYGTSVRTVRYLIGYDRCGNPVWGYRTVTVAPPRYIPPSCPPPRYYVPPVYPRPQPYYRGYDDHHGRVCR